MEKVYVTIINNKKRHSIIGATSVFDDRTYCWPDFLKSNFSAGDLVCLGHDQYENLNCYFGDRAYLNFKTKEYKELRAILVTYNGIFLLPVLDRCGICNNDRKLGTIGHFNIICEKHFEEFRRKFLKLE